MIDRSGQQLDNYLLIRLLGRGSFGEVYLGENIDHKTQVAVKVLQSRLTNEELRGFLNEARIFRLKHPNIVSLLDFGVDHKTGIPFLVMDYAPNGTLRQRHPMGTIVPLATIVLYIKNITKGLQYAHDQKFIHRDIKPENLLIGWQGEILLGDFGTAIISQSERLSAQSEQEVAGTPYYMAPEQFVGKPSRASDQYALGIIVYAWLSGAPPFKGTFFELATQHQASLPQPLHRKIPTISPDVEQVVMRALDKDPKSRFDSVQAFASALEEASERFLNASTVIEKTKEQWLEEGKAHYSACQYEAAIEAYCRAIELDLKYAPCYYRRGIAYNHLGEYWRAINDYNRAIELDPGYFSVFYRRGVTYFSLKEYNNAIADLDRTIELDSKYMPAYYCRGQAYAELKEYRKAITDYNHAIELDPRHAVIYYMCGQAYAELRDYHRAIHEYDRAIELRPGYSEAYHARERVYLLLYSTE